MNLMGVMEGFDDDLSSRCDSEHAFIITIANWFYGNVLYFRDVAFIGVARKELLCFFHIFLKLKF